MARETPLVPPVHQNCRCFIGADDVWYDAQDARVCPTCMLLGASWNMRLDVPQDPNEIERLLDRDTLEQVREAVAKDRRVIDRIIMQGAEIAESGIIKQVTSVAGEPLQIAIEREIVKARAAARAAAPIQAGRVVPGLGRTPDALVFETTPVGKSARLVSVNVATGRSFRVLWRGGKYLLQTVGGRTIDSSTDVWWLLLLLGLLEKKRRDDEERRRQAEQAAASQA